MSRAKHWCFTLNNPTEEEKNEVERLVGPPSGPCSYAVFGREVGEGGTPHLQGYCISNRRVSLHQCKLFPGLARAHLEISRGTPLQASTYCKKDGDYTELGELPQSQGKRNDFVELREWVRSRSSPPSKLTLWEHFPTLAARYPKACSECIELFAKRPRLVREEDTPRPWQQRLIDLLQEAPDDRKIIFVVDEDGGKGKSWLCRYLYTRMGDAIQRLSIGKRDDLAYAIDPTKKIFLFDINRGGMEFLQYGILEGLKDGLIFSPKYMSSTKVLKNKAHVVVFSNEAPDMTKLTRDRYKLFRLNQYN